jgi:hypothetical protein
MSRGATARLFVAVDPPAAACEELAVWARAAAAASGAQRAGAKAASLRLLPAQALHLTLCFLGARPVAEIERTRLRRNWHAYHGVAGARVLYPIIFTATVEKAIPTQVVHYSQLLENPESLIRSMAQFCGYASSDEQVTAATQFIENSAAARAAKG